MQFGQYENPENLREHPEREKSNKTLVVLCTYIPIDETLQYNTRKGDDYKRYYHNRLECLKFVLACYRYYSAGVEYDLLIVDNDSPSENFRRYLENCGYQFYIRPNTFFSFGAYKSAWKNLGKYYDYFVFHEMDWAPCHNGWLKQFIDIWQADKNIGMIGNLLEERGWIEGNELTDEDKVNNAFIEKINPNRKYHYNLDSEYLFTDKKVLEQMDKVGWLLFPCVPETSLSATYNELAFQQPILEMGYKIAAFSDKKHTMFYAICNQDFYFGNKGFENLTPFVPEQARYFCPEIKEYFNWYKGADSFKGYV
jgi:hypothetical protein